MNGTKAAFARKAAEFEADAERYPEERGELLLEAAAQWRFAGESDRALPLLHAVVAAGGEDGQFARAELATLRFEAGDVDGAFAELETLRAERPLHVAPCHMAAETLEEHGYLDESLAWFNVATTRLGEDELARAGDDDGWSTYAGVVLIGRRRVREALGLPEDALDAATPVPPGLRLPRPFPTAEDLLDDLADSPEPPDGDPIPFWPRSEVRAVSAQSPETLGPEWESGYHRSVETALRDLAAQGVHPIDLVPATAGGVDAFAWYDHGSHLSWPPPRNGPCWCGSGAKYKKCCGRPTA